TLVILVLFSPLEPRASFTVPLPSGKALGLSLHGETQVTTMSRFVVINEAGQSSEPAPSPSTALGHSSEKAGPPRHIPCASCVRRLTSASPRSDLACLHHLGRKAKKCFQCSSNKKLCYELPPGAVAFGREFQDATIRRSKGWTVRHQADGEAGYILTCPPYQADNWEILGEKTMQAINEANQRPVKRKRVAKIVPTTETESLMEGDASGSGQLQADVKEQQPSVQPPRQQPQPPCQEEPAQSNGDLQPPMQDMASRQDLQDLRAQILHDVRQVLVDRHQDKSEPQEESRERGSAPPAPPAAEPPTEQHSLNETVRGVMDAAQRSREGVATIVIHFH
ncbi:hypothetical protein J3F83DRAFT_559764, partial [Trichoderma novae-zelandiae]